MTPSPISAPLAMNSHATPSRASITHLVVTVTVSIVLAPDNLRNDRTSENGTIWETIAPHGLSSGGATVLQCTCLLTV